jgi:hypothetical protein
MAPLFLQYSIIGKYERQIICCNFTLQFSATINKAPSAPVILLEGRTGLFRTLNTALLAQIAVGVSLIPAILMADPATVTDQTAWILGPGLAGKFFFFFCF